MLLISKCIFIYVLNQWSCCRSRTSACNHIILTEYFKTCDHLKQKYQPGRRFQQWKNNAKQLLRAGRPINKKLLINVREISCNADKYNNMLKPIVHHTVITEIVIHTRLGSCSHCSSFDFGKIPSACNVPLIRPVYGVNVYFAIRDAIDTDNTLGR